MAGRLVGKLKAVLKHNNLLQPSKSNSDIAFSVFTAVLDPAAPNQLEDKHHGCNDKQNVYYISQAANGKTQ